MNSKLMLIIAAVVLAGGGYFAVRNLTSVNDVSVQTSERSEIVDEGEPAMTNSAPDTDDATRISSAQTGNSRNQPTAGRTFSRSEGAAAIDVTPATTMTMQAEALAVRTPETTTTEESVDNARTIADLASMFKTKTDPDDRIDIADELGLIDDPAGIQKVLELLKEEQDPTVQTALLEALQGLEALEMTGPEVLQAVTDILGQTTDPDVRIAAQDVLGDLATAEAAAVLAVERAKDQADPAETLNAAENLLRVGAADPSLVPPQEVAAINQQLKEDYLAGPDVAFRTQAIMALGINGRSNIEFFQQAMQTEQDPQLKTLLERMVTMFTAAPPATPPPGTVVTPVPIPDTQ